MLVAGKQSSSPRAAFNAICIQTKIKARHRQVMILLLFLPIFFSIFRYIPGLEWTLDVAIFATVILAIATWRWIPSSFNIYILIVSLVIPIWGAVCASLVFSQPLWLGLATQRAYLLALFALSIGRLISRRWITLSEIGKAFIILAWINLACCAPVVLFLDPNQYNDVGALVSDGGGVYNQFNLPLVFIVFGAFYYTGLWFNTNRIKHLAISAPFFLYIFGGNSGRILNISVISAVIFLAFMGSPRKRRAGNIFNILGVLVVVAGLASLAAPEKFNTMVAKYADAFMAIDGQDAVDDPSANARILQTAIALPLITGNVVAGTGSISNRWNEGYKGLLGYFHPSDLGLLGVVFVYGSIGLLFFSVQYIFAWRFGKKLIPTLHSHSESILLLAIMAYLLFVLVSSITTGAYAFAPEQSLFFLALLHAGLGMRPSPIRSVEKTRSIQLDMQHHA